MSKVYKGYKLLKAIENREIKENTEFLTKNKTKIYYDGSILRYKEAYCGIKANTEIGMSWLKGEFELIEDNTIDIESIEGLTGRIDIRCNNKNIEAEDYFYNTTNIVKSIKSTIDKHNELVQAVKQLNKEIKSIKEFKNK